MPVFLVQGSPRACIVSTPALCVAVLPLVVGLFAAPRTVAAQTTPPPSSEKTESAQTSALDSTKHGEQKPATPDSDSKLFGGRRWAIGVVGGYYAPTADIYGLKVDPLGPTFGFTASWTMQNGVWFGVQGQYFPGSTVSQTYRVPFTGTDVDVDADTQLTSFGASVGYDHQLGRVVVRFALDVGVSLVTWDMGDVPYYALSGYSPMQGSSATPYLAPGLGIVIPFGGFFLAPEFRYRLELGDQAPSAIGGQLHSGWRF